MSARKMHTLPAPSAPAVHRIFSDLLTRRVRVLVVGCGGTGSEIVSGLPYLHQAMLAHGHPGGLDVLMMDGDVVSPTNTVRQAFSQSDVGHPKATILMGRLNAFWGLSWRAIPRHLEPHRSAPKAGGMTQRIGADIVIGCVDTRRARRVILDRLSRDERVAYWLDIGNDSASGQFVLGSTRGVFDLETWRRGVTNPPAQRDLQYLPTVAALYPETVDAAADKGDDRPSCSAVEALARQEPMVNRVLAAHALALLARLFRYGEITHHGAFVNLETGSMRPIPISPEYWASTMLPVDHTPARRRKAVA